MRLGRPGALGGMTMVQADEARQAVPANKRMLSRVLRHNPGLPFD